MAKMRIGFLHSLIRPEEKLLIKELQSRSEIELILLDDRRIEFDIAADDFGFDLVLNRSFNQSAALNAVRLFESLGTRCISSAHTAGICGDKVHTSAVLRAAGIQQPDVRVAFSEKAALSAIEKMGYPVVLKPAVGSWGRLLSKINDAESAMAILQHKKALGAYHHTIYYIQKYVEKRGRDIRCIVIGGECVAASYRTADHWITNVARGAISIPCAVTDEIAEIALAAAKAVAGEIVGIDLFEIPGGYLVNEINHTLEFKGCMAATGCTIPARITDFLIGQVAVQNTKRNGNVQTAIREIRQTV